MITPNHAAELMPLNTCKHKLVLNVTVMATSTGAWEIIKVLDHHHRWLARWLWPGNKVFLEVDSMVVSWWIVAFLHSADTSGNSGNGF